MKLFARSGLLTPRITFGKVPFSNTYWYSLISSLRTVEYGLMSAVVARGLIKERRARIACEHSLGWVPTTKRGVSVITSSHRLQRVNIRWPGKQC